MESNDYRIDRVAISEKNEQLALVDFEAITENCNITPVAFVKKNYDFKKIRDRKTEPNVLILLSVAWTKICALSGLKTADSFEISQDITNMIFSVYSDLTIEEIYKAFELERFNVYDSKTEHYQLFNSDYVSAVLKKYKNWKQEVRRVNDIKPPESQNSIPEITESRKREIISQGILRVFNEYVETKMINEPFTHVFDELVSRNIIKIPTKKTPKLAKYFHDKLEQAGKEIVKELKSEGTENIFRKKTIQSEIEKAKSGGSDKVQVRAKRIVLKEFFEKHIQLKTDMDELINQQNTKY